MILFKFQVPRHVWPDGKEVSGCPLDDYLKKYQNPVESDPMMKVKNELSWSCQAHFALSSLDQLQQDFDIFSK